MKLNLKFTVSHLSSILLVLPVLISCNRAPLEEAPHAEIHSRPPNVLLISIDTLRADRMSLHGYDRPTTPFLESLAAESVVFDSFFYSGGGTLPSHMSMLTSLYPRTHFVHPGNQRILEKQRITLAEQLREEGFSTAAFTDSGWMRRRFGFGQGFDLFDDEGGGFRSIVPKALQWLEAHKERPFFLFLHTYDVHTNPNTKLPYACPGNEHLLYVGASFRDFTGCQESRCGANLLGWINSEVRTKGSDISDFLTEGEIDFISTLYDGCINYVDAQIETVMEALRALGLYENAMIVITSDHGEEFAEHGLMLHEQGGYEELARVPLLVKFANGQFGGRRVPEMGTIVDIMPTILEALEIEPNSQVQGVSLIPAIDYGISVRKDLHMYSILRTTRWKYFSDQKELYDLEADPDERKNVYDQWPLVVAELEKRVRGLAQIDIQSFEDFRASLDGQETLVKLTAEEEENLRALGYLR